MQKVGIIGMWQETNSFSSRPTTLAEFEAFELLEGDAILRHHAGKGSVIGGFLEELARPLTPALSPEGRGGDGTEVLREASPLPSGERVRVRGSHELEPIPLFSAGAWPAAPPDRATTAELLRRLDAALISAPNLDGLLVNLHGAMVCDGASDMEAETLSRIRQRFPNTPLVAVLDLHANFSAAACAFCDAVVGYRTYPHIDMRECGIEAATLLRRAMGDQRLVTAYGKLGVLTTPLAQGTAVEPMRGLLQRAEDRAAAAGVHRVTLLPGFPYGDVARCGFAVLAVAGAAQAAAAVQVVANTLADIKAHLGDFAVTRPQAEAAVREAVGLPAPVVLADIADNVGGGSPGDGTTLLAELVRQRVAGSVVIIADAEVAAQSHAAGVGATFAIKIGGKRDSMHGAPVAVTAKVVRLSDGSYTSGGSWMKNQSFSMGPTAVLEVDGRVTVLVTSVAVPPFHIEQLTSNGIDPTAASVIVAKGAVAWRAAYEDVMKSVIEVDTPGCTPIDPFDLPRTTQPEAVAAHIPRRV